MSYQHISEKWLNAALQSGGDADYYSELAGWCEQLAPGEQRAGFDRIMRELADFGISPDNSRKDVASQWIALLADSGAFESAAIALIPETAIFTGGRLQDGSFVAQVILQGSAGAHSRGARSLSMAWLAALLRALARQGIEMRSVSGH